MVKSTSTIRAKCAQNLSQSRYLLLKLKTGCVLHSSTSQELNSKQTQFFVGAHTPCFLWLPTHPVVCGYPHTMFSVGAHTLCSLWVPTHRVLWGCPHTIFFVGAYTLCSLWMPTHRVLCVCPYTTFFVVPPLHHILCGPTLTPRSLWVPTLTPCSLWVPTLTPRSLWSHPPPTPY